MNSFRSLNRVIATTALLTLGSSLGVAATATPTVPAPDFAAMDVSQALDRLNAENNKRVNESIDDSVAALAAMADDTVVAVNRPSERNAGARVARDFRRLHRMRG